MFLLTHRNVLHLLWMSTFVHIKFCQAKSLVNESSMTNMTDGLLWQPKERTREEWLACRGMPKDVCERTKSLQDSSSNQNDEDQRIVFTEEQLDMMVAEAKKKEKATSRHRAERALIDFKNNPNISMWSMPIHYMFDGTHDDDQKATIRRAFQHWADNTCIRFEELPMNASFNSSYILIKQTENEGCESHVGRTSDIPQNLNLESECVAEFSTILHEIGHALGLEHEQSRIDRNDSVRILWNNIKNESLDNFNVEKTDDLGLPYNYGSVMHYSSKGDNSLNGNDTMIALDPLYQMNMGQSVDLSFQDRKIINLAYCKDNCTTPLNQPCQRSGYQNPNNCSTCICPDGFSGQYCSEIAPPQHANCGGKWSITSGTEYTIKSPGYGTTGYTQRQECTWLIKAPENYMLQLSFRGNFSIYCEESACAYHWVEIKYKKYLGLEGARFCCDHRPRQTVTSESNEMMVIFRSSYIEKLVDKEFDSRGFQAIVQTIPPVSSRSGPTSTSTNSYTSGYLLLIVLLQLRHLLYR